MPSLPVIFRAERRGPFKGEVTAVFPTIPADYAGHQMTCYAHTGQHGGCSFDWYRGTRPAKPEEYADLLTEIRGIYGRDGGPDDPPTVLRVARRITADHRREFEADARRNLETLRSDPSGGPWSPGAREAAADAMAARGISAPGKGFEQ